MSERLQKVLAQKGFGSRREMDKWIEQGFIKVNGQVAQLGQKVNEKDKIHVKGRLIKNPLTQKDQLKVLLYHKPVGQICTKNDPENRKTVFTALPKLAKGRWIMVGRLDINTSGLLLFTNNGEFANQLMHPNYQFEREYAVRIFGKVDESLCRRLLEGVQLEDGMAAFKTIQFSGGEGANSWYHVTLTEGRNREVRRLWESQGVEVSRLCRVRYGSITLPKYVKRGSYTELNEQQINTLKKLIK